VPAHSAEHAVAAIPRHGGREIDHTLREIQGALRRPILPSVFDPLAASTYSFPFAFDGPRPSPGREHTSK
jgi:hypothetical protein